MFELRRSLTHLPLAAGCLLAFTVPPPGHPSHAFCLAHATRIAQVGWSVERGYQTAVRAEVGR